MFSFTQAFKRDFWTGRKEVKPFKVDCGEDNQHCLHDNCPECHGSGRKPNGETCVHMISCPCRKCKPCTL